MAQQLQNPFAQDYPETIDHIHESTAQRCKFNRVQGPWAGSLLATGGADGVVEVWDMEMTGGALVRAFDGHVKGVESLSWSRNGRYLLSVAKDWRCNIWDLSFTNQNTPGIGLIQPSLASPSSAQTLQTRPTSALHYGMTLEAPLTHAEFHPYTSKMMLMCNTVNEVVLVKLREGTEEIPVAGPSTSNLNGGSSTEAEAAADERPRKRRKIIKSHEVSYLSSQTREEAIQAAQMERMVTEDGGDGDDPMEGEQTGTGTGEVDMAEFEMAPGGHATACASLTFANFDPMGERIYAGTKDGWLWVYDARTRWIVHRQRVSSSVIKQVGFDRSGRYMVVNSGDRAVRVLNIIPRQPNPDPTSPKPLFQADIQPLHRFQDTIGRTPWNSVGFSGDGEYVIGGAGIKTSHFVYVWDRSTGVLVKVLEGPKDSLDDCDWSPSRAMIASVTSAGEINIWQTNPAEQWSAFAPGFEELEENREYLEREDEFDIEDETEVNRRKQAEEDQDIDVLTSRFGFNMFSEAAGHDKEYWLKRLPDDDNDEFFWPHDDLEDPMHMAMAQVEER